MSYHPNEVARRARAARAVVALVLAALGLGFFRAQVLRSNEYAMVVDGQRLREVPLAAPRGIIYDRNGEIVAENLPGYTVSLLSPTVDSLNSALDALSKVIPIDRVQRNLVMRRFERARNRPAVIFNDASFEVVSALEERRIDFPGLIIQSSPKRYYPDGEAIAAIIGYTNEITDQDLLLPEFEESYKAGQQIGRTGLERKYESRLRGLEGSHFVEVDARGRVVREQGVRDDVPPKPPEALRSTLDMDLQRFIHETYGDSLRGAVVALDPMSGGVLALYSGPTFDANRFTGGVAASYYDQLNTDPARPMYNKAVQGAYEPASTWKLATSIIAMEQGLVEIDTRMEQPCTGGYQFGSRRFRCWKPEGHGNVTLAQAIANSCDVYFYQLGLKIGLKNLVAGGLRLGFGERTGIDLPFETRSTFPDSNVTKYYNDKYGARGWTNAVTLNLSIGQGENSQTVINMARFYTALATDGAAAPPHLIETDVERKQLFNLRPEQLAALRAAMADVVSGRGTAGSAALQGIVVAGKTGTAQNPPNPDHAWFVGFAPYEKPQIVVAVFLEYGLHGYAAARIATKVMERYLNTSLINASATTAAQ
jgi:penicillin-binding protein 2